MPVLHELPKGEIALRKTEVGIDSFSFYHVLTSDSESLTAALEKLREEYQLSRRQCKGVLKQFKKLGVSPVTLKNSSDYTTLPALLP